LACGIPYRPHADIGFVPNGKVRSREGTLVDLDPGRAGISVLRLQQGGVEGEPNVNPVEFSHVFDDDVHADGIAN
jgi:hypothetical protein